MHANLERKSVVVKATSYQISRLWDGPRVWSEKKARHWLPEITSSLKYLEKAHHPLTFHWSILFLNMIWRFF